VTNDEIRDFLQQAIDENRVMLFMKGTPNQPQCGFSARASGALNALGVQYAALDILPDPRIREELSQLSGWPTIPQLFVDKELVGGSDIIIEMFESGELADLLGVEQPEAVEAEPQVPTLDLGPDLVEGVQLDPFVVAEVLDDDPIAANPYEVALDGRQHALQRRSPC
jgi:monothiol glutaredoxin